MSIYDTKEMKVEGKDTPVLYIYFVPVERTKQIIIA